jgi:uncharacterized membrane protein YhaH (DUF805 family)
MGSKGYWIMIIITAIAAVIIFSAAANAGPKNSDLTIGIIFSFIAVITAAIAEKQKG